MTGMSEWVATMPKSSSVLRGIARPLFWTKIMSSVPRSRKAAMTKNWTIPLTIMFFWL